VVCLCPRPGGSEEYSTSRGEGGPLSFALWFGDMESDLMYGVKYSAVIG